ncbi:MAG: hypothetical protein RR898_01470 [Clostridium sp.]|uniref:hypothetical protein n=1 Tax=Clostridium sp. TaxID=1506 RepID=UPI002FCAAE38
MQNAIDKCIESNKIIEVVRLELYDTTELTSELYNYNSYENYNSLIENKHVIIYESKLNALKKLNIVIKNKAKIINKELSIINKVKKHHKRLNHYDKNDNVYLKFGRDKHNELIAMYFNIDKFVNNNSRFSNETVYVFSEEGDYPYENHTVMHLSFTNYYEARVSCLYIGDFISNNQRKGHATFLLKNLRKLVICINKRIEYLNCKMPKNYYEKSPINAITGEVCPGSEISFDDLVDFYNKNGLSTRGHYFTNSDYNDNRIIFQEFNFKI